MDLQPSTLLGFGAAAVAGIVWLVRLEGRINLTDARYVDLRQTMQEIREDVKALLNKQYGRRETDTH